MSSRPPFSRRPTITCAAAFVVIGPALATWGGGLAWPIDILAAFSKHVAFITALVAVAAVAARWWCLFAAASVALALHLAPWDSPRARRVVPTANAVATRIVQFNVGGLDRQPSALLSALLSHEADVIVVIEGGHQMLKTLSQSPALAKAYPATRYPEQRDTRGWCMVLSRWPTRLLGTAPETSKRHLPVAWTADLRIVDQPDRPFLLAVVHPPSARNPWSWQEGNLLVQRLIRRLDEIRRTEQLPVVVVADLNATPTSWRSRILCREANLRRCLPRWSGRGTFPARWRWPLRLAIDDLWVDPDIHVSDWHTRAHVGSDHLAIQVHLHVPVDPSSNVGVMR